MTRHLLARARARKRYHAPVSAMLGLGLALIVVYQWNFGGLHNSEQMLSLGDTDARRLQAYPKDVFFGDALSDGSIKEPSQPHWAIIFHIIGASYMILGLNIVCDAYFCEALNLMVSEWKVQPDVAGATFMAAGGSAPELFTSIIGVFLAESDVGFGTIVGSAVFNVLFVIGLCAAASTVPLKLTWWPLFRDCSYYILGLLMLSGFCFDSKIELHEAIILFALYIGYCIIMLYNEKLHHFVETRFARNKAQVAPIDDKKEDAEALDAAAASLAAADPKAPPANRPSADTLNHLSPMHKAQIKAKMGSVAKIVSVGRAIGRRLSMSFAPGHSFKKPESAPPAEPEEEDEEKNPFKLLKECESKQDLVLAVLSLPVTVMLWVMVPDCTLNKWKKYFVLTFGVSLVAIAFYSYMLVWWATIIGEVVGIPTVIMGYTFLAAGTSIPDAISSVVMAKLGEGDMAVSSSIGSNVFDILVGLPLPWIIYTAWATAAGDAKDPDYVNVQSPYLVINVMILLIMVAAVVLSIHCQGWVLNKTLGWIMTILYFIFLVVAITIESTQPDALKMATMFPGLAGS